MKITTSDYQKILKQVQFSLSQAQDKIIRSKVEMSWKVGQIIDRALDKKDEKTYGKHLIEKLEKDVGINETTLYKMRSFYQAYPKLPKDDPKLNWSHYRVLAGIKEKSERKALENLVKENLWSGERLQKEMSERKAPFEKGGGVARAAEGDLKYSEFAKPKSSGATRHLLFQRRQIQPNRGVLSTYKILEVVGSNKKFFDCGFGIFWEAKGELPKDAKVVFVEGSKITKSAAKPQQVYTYKAYLKRLVDGDTIHANIDLGFGIWHEEIIRLAKINAAESKSDEGARSSKELQKIFDSVPFFILKSIKTDIYNRYVCDIFLPQKNQTNLQKIADEGIYLNQLLLDRKLVELF